MSSEWAEVSIGQVCEVTSSKRIFAHEYVEKGIPFYGSKEVIDKALGTYSDTSVFISNARFSEIADKFGYPTAGDLLLSSVGNRAGIPYVVKGEGKFYFKDGNLTWFRNFKGLNSHFLCHWMKSTIGQSSLNSIMIGSAQKALTINGLLKLRISVPSLQQQERIVAILNALDDRITVLRETNATLEAIAQALFTSWFVDFDPVRAKIEGRAPEGMDEATAALFPNSFEESELGLVPRGWPVGTLADLSNLNPESWTAKNHPDTVAYIDLANAKNNEIASVTDFSFNDAPSRARRVLRDGDTIVGTVRPGNRSFAFIHEPANNLTASTGFAVLRPLDSANTEFVYLAATQDTSIEHLEHVADGGAYPAVRPDVVSGLQCIVPDKHALEAFHAIAAPLLAKVAANQTQVQTLATLRDTLLPRLISGQLRLPATQAAAEEALA